MNLTEGPINLQAFTAHFQGYLRNNRMTIESYAKKSGELESKVLAVLKGESRPTRQMLIDMGWREMMQSERKYVWVEVPYYVKVKPL